MLIKNNKFNFLKIMKKNIINLILALLINCYNNLKNGGLKFKWLILNWKNHRYYLNNKSVLEKQRVLKKDN